MNKSSNAKPMAMSRAKKRANGLVPVEAWVHHSNRAKLKALIAELQIPAVDAPAEQNTLIQKTSETGICA